MCYSLIVPSQNKNTIFNLSHRVLTDAEIKVLEKGLDFAPIQWKINGSELKQDFNDFCRRMYLKWYFWDETQEFSRTPGFSTKSTWNPPYWPSPYLHFSSAHPNHTKRSIVFSQTLHISRLCSNESDFEWNKEKMKSSFVKREYPEKLIDSEIRKVKFNIRETNRKNKSKNGVPFIVTYHPLLNSLYGIIRKNLYLLNMDQRVKEVFSSQPMVSFRSVINWVAI